MVALPRWRRCGRYWDLTFAAHDEPSVGYYLEAILTTPSTFKIICSLSPYSLNLVLHASIITLHHLYHHQERLTAEPVPTIQGSGKAAKACQDDISPGTSSPVETRRPGDENSTEAPCIPSSFLNEHARTRSQPTNGRAISHTHLNPAWNPPGRCLLLGVKPVLKKPARARRRRDTSHVVTISNSNGLGLLCGSRTLAHSDGTPECQTPALTQTPDEQGSVTPSFQPPCPFYEYGVLDSTSSSPCLLQTALPLAARCPERLINLLTETRKKRLGLRLRSRQICRFCNLLPARHARGALPCLVRERTLDELFERQAQDDGYSDLTISLGCYSPRDEVQHHKSRRSRKKASQAGQRET